MDRIGMVEIPAGLFMMGSTIFYAEGLPGHQARRGGGCERGAGCGSASAPEASPPAAAPEEDPTVAKLNELAQLHASGVLTDEEFAAAKAKALGID